MSIGPEPGTPLATRPTSRVIAAWLAVAAWMGLIWWLGSGGFGAPTTSRYLLPLLRWLFPDTPGRELWEVAMAIRKLAHPAVYGVLAGLTYDAMRVSGVAPALRAAAWALGLALVLAVLDESRQAGLAARTGSATDVLLDASGAGFVLGALLLLARRRRIAPLGGA